MRVVTIAEIDSFIKSLQEDRSDLYEFKPRGRGQYIPEVNKERFILLTFIIEIFKDWRSIIKRSKHQFTNEEIIDVMKRTDWRRYSYNGVPFTSDDLPAVLMYKPKKSDTMITLLDMQYEYLEKAYPYIIDVLED